MNECLTQADDSFEHRFFLLLTRIYRLLHQHADHNMPADALSPPQLWFLKRLDDAGAPQPISYFADGVVSNRSNASQMIDRLESEGLVARVRHPSDRRSVLVQLTDKGAARMRDGHECLDTLAKELLQPLIFLHDNDKYTIPLGLATFRSTYGSSPWHLIMSVSIGAALPPVILFFVGQKFLLTGIVVSDK